MENNHSGSCGRSFGFFKKTHDMFLMALPLFLAIAFTLILIKSYFPNSDTFFIIATGQHIVESGAVPTVNPFVIHDGLHIVVQQWLFDVIIYYIYAAAGNLGLYLYSVGILFASLFMMYKFFGFYSQNKQLKLLLLTFCSLMASFFVVVRPTSMSFLLCLSVVMVMESYRRNHNHWMLLLLPLLSLVTVNIHSSMWPMLFVLMVPFIFPDKLPQAKELGFWKSLGVFIGEWVCKWKWVLLAMLGMFLVGFANPNGIAGMRYVFLSYGSATTANFIAELQSPAMTSFIGILVIVSILLLFKYVDKFRSKMDFAKFYMAFGTIVLAAMHNRDLWFLVFGAIPLFFVFFDKFAWKNKKTYKSAVPYVIMNGCFACLIMLLFVFSFNYGSLQITDTGTSPVEAATYLNESEDLNKDEVVLFTEFNNGAYMEFHGYQVYIDARPELFQKNVNGKADIYTEYLLVHAGAVDFEAFIGKYQFTHMIVSDSTPLSGFLRSYDNAELVVDGNGYCMYEIVSPIVQQSIEN